MGSSIVIQEGTNPTPPPWTTGVTKRCTLLTRAALMEVPVMKGIVVMMVLGVITAVVLSVMRAEDVDKTKVQAKEAITRVEQPVINVTADVEMHGQADRKLALYDIEQELLAYTNAARIRHGLKPLMVDQAVLNSSRSHAIWMSQNGSMTHGRLNGVSGEIIAAGQPSSESVVNAWLNSPGHRALLLSPSFRFVGMACYRRGNGQIYWCEQFK
jgi:uncharacterized protein YkwD